MHCFQSCIKCAVYKVLNQWLGLYHLRCFWALYFCTICKSRGIGFYIGNHIVAVAPELKTFIGMGLILHDQHLRCPKWIICFSGLAGFGEYQKWHPITQFGRSGAHAMHWARAASWKLNKHLYQSHTTHLLPSFTLVVCTIHCYHRDGPSSIWRYRRPSSSNNKAEKSDSTTSLNSWGKTKL